MHVLLPLLTTVIPLRVHRELGQPRERLCRNLKAASVHLRTFCAFIECSIHAYNVIRRRLRLRSSLVVEEVRTAVPLFRLLLTKGETSLPPCASRCDSPTPADAHMSY